MEKLWNIGRIEAVFTILLCIMLISCKEDDSSNGTKQPDLQETTIPLASPDDLDTLIGKLDNKQFVLLGDASHGTLEYYEWRAEITKKLVAQHQVAFIGVEGDWADIYKLNEYINGKSTHQSAGDLLKTFSRWPTWMWANETISELSEWLKQYNSNQPEENKVGFYGLDLYGIGQALEEALRYLENNHPSSVATARAAIGCFAPFLHDEQSYGYAAFEGNADCSDEFSKLLNLATSLRQTNATITEAFSLEQNALVAVNGEKFYSTSVTSYEDSLNIRDRHMVETINRLRDFKGEEKKAVVWEHNTHIGDARATDMAKAGMVNVGQLVREEHGQENVYLIGFGSYEGTVMAGSSWGAAAKIMTVPPSPSRTWEGILHNISPPDKIVIMEGLANAKELSSEIGHRAIGVVYDPKNESGNYVPSILPKRYDAFIFIDKTNALKPVSGGSTSTILKNAFGFQAID